VRAAVRDWASVPGCGPPVLVCVFVCAAAATARAELDHARRELLQTRQRVEEAGDARLSHEASVAAARTQFNARAQALEQEYHTRCRAVVACCCGVLLWRAVVACCCGVVLCVVAWWHCSHGLVAMAWWRAVLMRAELCTLHGV
jgi:hypothetical protein